MDLNNMTPEQLSEALHQLSQEDKDAIQSQLGDLLVIYQDDGVAASHGRWIGTTVIVAAGFGVLFPVAGIGGIMGIAGFIGTIGGIPLVGLHMFNQERKAIRSGDMELLEELVAPDRTQQIKDKALEIKIEALKKQPLPQPTPKNLEAETQGNQPAPTKNPQTPTEPEPKPEIPQTPKLDPKTLEPITPSTIHNSLTELGIPKQPSATPPSAMAKPKLEWKDEEHMVMIGLSGSSKTSTLLSCTPKDAVVLYVTIKSEDVAPNHWVSCKLSKFSGLQVLQQLDDLCDILEQLINRGVKHRLIVDEALSIIELAEGSESQLVREEQSIKNRYKGTAVRFRNLIKVYIRTGRSDGHYLGLVTQSPNGTDLFKSAKTMQGLKKILCAGEASAEKFLYLVDWSKQIFGNILNNKDLEMLAKVDQGFWHFWNDKGFQRAESQKIEEGLERCANFSKVEVMRRLNLQRIQVVKEVKTTEATEIPQSEINVEAKTETPKRSRWDTVYEGFTAEHPYMHVLMDWIKSTTLPEFTANQARNGSAVRKAFEQLESPESSTTKRVEIGLRALAELGIVQATTEGRWRLIRSD